MTTGKPLSDEVAINTILALLGNVDHSRPGGPNDAAHRGGLLEDVRKIALEAKNGRTGTRDPMTVAVLWTGDTQAIIAGGPTREDALDTLRGANPHVTDTQAEGVDFAEATRFAIGTWIVEVDGN